MRIVVPGASASLQTAVIRCGARTNRGGTLHPSSIGSTKTHQHIHQWNTVRSVPKPNVFDTHGKEACTSREWAASEGKSVNPFISARGAPDTYAR
jgi:hypothetical protein